MTQTAIRHHRQLEGTVGRRIAAAALIMLVAGWLTAGAAMTSASQDQAAAPSPPRTLTVEDLFQLKDVGDPQISPDGKWVAYTVTTTSLKEEKSETQVWMIPFEGGEPIPLTAKGSSASHPRWSPDNKFLAFLAARGEQKTQVWQLNRLGGEAQSVTEIPQGVRSFEWAPDGGRLLLEIKDPSPEEIAAQKDEEQGVKPARPRTQPPWVIDRLQTKRDYQGYLDRCRVHLYVFDLAAKKLSQVTSGDYDDSEPAWSPDGRLIAFVSNRDREPDATFNTEIWLVASDTPDKGQTLVRLTTNPGEDDHPAWSPDGTSICYITNTAPELFWYATRHLAVVPAAGGPARILTGTLDRNASDPRFSPDGKSIDFILEDGGEQALARVGIEGGGVTRIIQGPRVVYSYVLGKDGTPVALISEPTLPAELFVSGTDGLRRLTKTNDALISQLRLSPVETARFKSKDGTEVEGFFYKPIGFDPKFRYPALLLIHGGPVSEFDHGFDFDAQLYAANGYLVIQVNPRGSSGYGQNFCKAIFADWGNKDAQDVLAGVDAAIAKGYADPERLGVGGWSYGGILTNYVISQTTRFKAAVSGAGGILWAASYGHDHYQREYIIELGPPWKNRAVWDRISSAFYNVEKIVTPTLIMGGEVDWNVPIMNSEHLYQALRQLGRTTQLVVYPGQHHGLSKPSYQKDRLERDLAWYDKYVKGAARAAAK
jgi:dipeptidyl aminopeptidase/acylaminoacyl peptidase